MNLVDNIKTAPKPGSQERVGVVVLGMHRSGTSALTRILNLLGCDLPKELMKANQHNEAGYWESTAICELNDKILESGGSNWSDWTAFNPRWHESPKAEGFREEARAALEQEFGASQLFVLKDPRLCRVVPFWIDVFKTIGIAPRFICPVRNPLEVAESLGARDGIDPSLCHLLWLRNVLDAEAATREFPRLFTNYDGLLTGWSSVADRAQSVLDIVWPRMPDQVVDEVEAFLSIKQRHYREAPDSVIRNLTLSNWIRDAYRIFDAWASSGEMPDDYAALDRIRREFNAAVPAFSRIVAAGTRAVVTSRQLERDLLETTGRLDQAEAASAELADASEQLRNKLTVAKLAIKDDEQAVSKLQAELSDRDRAAEEAQAALKDVSSKLAQTESALIQRRHEAEQTAIELVGARNELQRMAAASAEFAASLDKTRAEKAQVESRLKERFDEIAKLSRIILEKDNEILRKNAESKNIKQASVKEIGRVVVELIKKQRWPYILKSARLRHQVALLRNTKVFDAKWYLETNRDVANAKVDPERHYIEFGAKEGRAPNGYDIKASEEKAPVE